MGKPGRKGYDYEKVQLDKMRRLVNRFISLLERVDKKGEITKEDLVRYSTLEKSVLKIMDKLHPNKTDLKIEADKPLLILK